MRTDNRRLPYGVLCLLAVAFGWIEACVVVYLREIHAAGLSLQGAGLEVTSIALPEHLLPLEIAREAATIVLLASVAWIAGRRAADRNGAFLIAFGIWDLTYYAALRGVAGWPASLSTWDILFLIPLPWVAPVWAPTSVATLFTIAGTFLFFTPERERRYGRGDLIVLAASALVVIAAFLVESRAAIEHRTPESFPAWLFWIGVVSGMLWFVRVEARAVVDAKRSQWLGVSVRTFTPPPPSARPAAAGAPASRPLTAGEVGQIVQEYTEATRRRDALLDEATQLAERFERLAHGLSVHPQRLIVGVPSRIIDEPDAWDVVPSHPLPNVEDLSALTDAIREASSIVDELRERLILMGRADVTEPTDRFFH